MFSGVFQHSIDAKGRTSLPSKFREQLAAEGAEKLFITKDLHDPCLVAYSPLEWGRIAETMAKLPRLDPRTRALSRLFIAPAQECPVDKLGRILIPPTLREKLGPVEEITWAGQINKIEIWAPAKWDAFQQETANDHELLKRVSELL